MRTGKSSSGEEERKRRHGYAGLFDEDPGEQDHIAMMEKKFDSAMHAAGANLEKVTSKR